ncbi:hypothetical protein ACIPWY_31970 [Streptomyces sp. NPDC090032]|uniref:hypothetical protein n=1 Tax=unclassified Streptomyces TaxID=2593676 RepID=UPI0037145346
MHHRELHRVPMLDALIRTDIDPDASPIHEAGEEVRRQAAAQRASGVREVLDTLRHKLTESEARAVDRFARLADEHSTWAWNRVHEESSNDQ